MKHETESHLLKIVVALQSGTERKVSAHTSIAMPKQNDLQESFSISELAEKAAGDDLTSLDRINMQIEYEELRETLSSASLKMNEELARISHQKVDKTLLTETVAAPDGTKLDTVRDKIEGSVTSKESLKGIDAQLTRVKEMLETFSLFIMDYNGDDLDGGLTACLATLRGNLPGLLSPKMWLKLMLYVMRGILRFCTRITRYSWSNSKSCFVKKSVIITIWFKNVSTIIPRVVRKCSHNNITRRS